MSFLIFIIFSFSQNSRFWVLSAFEFYAFSQLELPKYNFYVLVILKKKRFKEFKSLSLGLSFCNFHKFKFLSCVTIWYFRFCQHLIFWFLPRYESWSFVTNWVLSKKKRKKNLFGQNLCSWFCHNLGSWVCHNMNF